MPYVRSGASMWRQIAIHALAQEAVEAPRIDAPKSNCDV
jgi:hypothetical protein